MKERMSKVETKLGYISKDLDLLAKDVKDILTIHLPHIKQDIQKNKWRIAVIVSVASFSASVLASTLVDRVFSK